MKMSRAASRYAKAALKYAGQELASLAKDLEQVHSLLKEHEDLSLFLENPILSNTTKKETLIKLMPKHSKAFAQLLNVLASNNRLSIIGAVSQQFQRLYASKQDQLTATVVTAVAITAALEEQVLKKAKSLTTQKVKLENKVDPTILGGFILTLGDMQYDASVLQKLRGIKTALMTKQ